MQKKEQPFIYKYLGNIGIFVGIIIIVVSCARQASPTGGVKDEKPPHPIKSSPINYSKNFRGNKIIILFDEFVVLKNPNQEILTSPPLKEKNEIKLRGKNILIKIKDTLKENTTYGIHFYDAIADLNEGNLLKDFSFEFSTGNTFDSLYLAGNVKNAFDYKVKKGWYVMLYDKFGDSIPRKQLPELISKTDENGNFVLTNLKNKPYYIFAIEDLNNNELFDLPNEKIAFLDSSFQPSFKEVEMIDTLVLIDSISPDLKDTVFYDSIHKHKEFVSTIGDIQLFMFQEVLKKQFFKKAYRKERQQVIFAFNENLEDSVSIFPILNNHIVKKKWFVQEKQTTADSLVFWIKDTSIFNEDSLFFQLNYTMLDSNNQNFIKIDTLLLHFEDVKKVKQKKDKSKLSLSNILGTKKEEKKDTLPPPSLLTFSNNIKTLLDLDTDLFLIARFPIKTVNDTAIQLFKIEDDTVNMDFNIFVDSLFVRQLHFKFEKKEDEKFKLLFPAGCITDIYGQTNDTLKYNFGTQKIEYYATIKVNIKGLKEPSIVQLLDNKKKIIKEVEINADTTINYLFLPPEKYVLKLFYDSNGNKKWDTGNYKEKKQPEKVFYFPTEINAVSNFDYDYDWDLYPLPKTETYTKTDTIRVPLNKK